MEISKENSHRENWTLEVSKKSHASALNNQYILQKCNNSNHHCFRGQSLYSRKLCGNEVPETISVTRQLGMVI